MESWKNLLHLSDRLLGEGGCPWDREQTLTTLQPYLLEEAHELIEAIDIGDPLKIKEELGDCLYTLIFIAKLASIEKLFTLDEAIGAVVDKLIRRHPHVFGDKKFESIKEVVQNWEEVKKKEGKKSPIEGIPATLPALLRAYKVIHKLKRASQIPSSTEEKVSSEEVGKRLWEIVKLAEANEIDPETALRRFVLSEEEKYRR